MSNRAFLIIVWILRVLPAIILLQTLFFKFSAAPESVYIFSTLGLEPWGRIITGILELITAVFLLVPRGTFLGAILGMALMGGALFSHLTKLGIVVQDDDGVLFILAVIVFISCLFLAIIFRAKATIFLPFRFKKANEEMPRL